MWRLMETELIYKFHSDWGVYTYALMFYESKSLFKAKPQWQNLLNGLNAGLII